MNNQLVPNHPRLSVNMTTCHKKIPPHVTGKLHTEIFTLTTYTQLYYKQKYRMFIKLHCTDVNKPMNAYNPRLYVNDSTSWKNTASCQISMSTFSYKPTYKNNSHAIILKSPPKTPRINLFTNRSPYKNTYNTHSLKKSIYYFFITNQVQNHHIFYYQARTYQYPERWLEIPRRRPRTYL